MTSHRKIFLFVFCGLIAAVTVCFFFLREREPSYKGRTLSEWLERYIESGAGMPDMDAMQESENAVRAIGTNAVPYLVEWNGAHDSRLKILITDWLSKLTRNGATDMGARINKTMMESSADHKRYNARTGFDILKTNAVSALKDLSRQFESATKRDDTADVAHCISQLGTNGLDALMGFANAPRSTMHYNSAVHGIVTAAGYLGTNAAPAVPVLVTALRRDVRVAAAGLRHIGLRPDISVPALASALDSTNVSFRRDILSALAGFGEAARPALPALQVALHDRDENWRKAVTNALCKIAPEVLTNRSASN